MRRAVLELGAVGEHNDLCGGVEQQCLEDLDLVVVELDSAVVGVQPRGELANACLERRLEAATSDS